MRAHPKAPGARPVRRSRQHPFRVLDPFRVLVGLVVLGMLATGSFGYGAAVGAAAAAASRVVVAETSAPRVAAEAAATAESARITALRPTPQAAPAPLRVPKAPHALTAPLVSVTATEINDPTSITVVVNKARALGSAEYVPADLVSVPVPHTWAPLLRQEAATAVVALFNAASAEAGLALASASAYRSYSAQQRVYAGFVSRSGEAYADTTSARAGHSEHQTGLALDIGAASGACSLSACFGDMAEGRWLVDNAWRFGFLLRYPADKAAITGFAYEPWHFRYIGVSLAATMHDTGTHTLEELFGLAAAADYL